MVVPIQNDAVPKHVRAIGITSFALPKKPTIRAMPQTEIATATHSSMTLVPLATGWLDAYNAAGNQSQATMVTRHRAATLILVRQPLRSATFDCSKNHHDSPQANGVKTIDVFRSQYTPQF